MALSSIGFGLKPINKMGSNYNAAQVTEYRGFSVNNNIQYALNMAVKIGRSLGRPQVDTQYTDTQPLTGSLVGLQFEDKNTGKPIFTDHTAAGQLVNIKGSGTTTAFDLVNGATSFFIADDPFQLFMIKSDGDINVSTMMSNYKLTPINNNGGGVSSDGKRSTAKLDASTASFTTSNVLNLLQISDIDGDVTFSEDQYGYQNSIIDENSNVIVRINNHTNSNTQTFR